MYGLYTHENVDIYGQPLTRCGKVSSFTLLQLLLIKCCSVNREERIYIYDGVSLRLKELHSVN